MENDIVNKGPDGGETNTPEQDYANKQLFSRIKREIDRAEKFKRKANNWAKSGLRSYKGRCDKEGDKEYDDAMQASEVNSHRVLQYQVNFLRQPIEAQLTKTYARNPKFIAKPAKPIFIDAPPAPQVDPMTGQVVMVPQINPETGMPEQIDVSEQICDVVEAIMELEFKNSDFKAEAKACTREAHHSPAGVMQVGYQYDSDTETDSIYFRRRRFSDFIIDPDAEIYDGVVRRCKFMGIKWKLTKDEAEGMGLNWDALKSKDSMSSDPEAERAVVYNIWHKTSGVVAWVPENGNVFAKEPEEWPWKIKGFPFEILKFTEMTDEQFSPPPIVDAMPIQEELNIQREEITANTTNARPFTMYDPAVIDEETQSSFQKREKYSYVPIKGLLGMPNSPIRREGDSVLSPEYYQHYSRNRQELNEVLGTSENEALRSTRSTAAEAQILDRNSGSATSGKIDIQSDFLNKCANKALQIMKQTYDTERVTQIIGRDNTKYWVRWVGSQILQDIEIEVETGSTEREDSAYSRQIALNMLEVMKGVPGIDVTKLAVEVLREHGKRNADQYQLAPQPQMMGGMADAGAGATTGANPGAGVMNQMNPMR